MKLKTAEILAEGNIRELDDAGVKDLAASILSVHTLSNGEKTLLQPVTVEKLAKKTPEGHTHRLRYGFRRLAAMEYLLKTYPEKCFWADQIPVNVDDAVYNEEGNSELNFRLIENIQRADMTLLEEATSLQRLMDEGGFKQSDLAKSLGKSKGWISQRLSLLSMGEAVQLGVQEGKLGQAHVRELARVKKKGDQAQIAEKLLKSADVSVEAVRKAVNKAIGPPAEKKPKKVSKVSAVKAPDEWDEADAAEAAAAAAESNEHTKEISEVPAQATSGEALTTPLPKRADVLKTMSHVEKIDFLKTDSDRRAAEEKASEKRFVDEGARLEGLIAAALVNGSPELAAFLRGAVEGIQFALGSRDSIVYSHQKMVG
jgi:ParB/RepB/Spo0J family partition protein